MKVHDYLLPLRHLVVCVQEMGFRVSQGGSAFSYERGSPVRPQGCVCPQYRGGLSTDTPQAPPRPSTFDTPHVAQSAEDAWLLVGAAGPCSQRAGFRVQGFRVFNSDTPPRPSTFDTPHLAESAEGAWLLVGAAGPCSLLLDQTSALVPNRDPGQKVNFRFRDT